MKKKLLSLLLSLWLKIKSNPLKSIITVVLLFLIGLLIFNLSTECCWPPALGKTNRDCEIGTLIVRLGYAIGGVIASLVAVAALERVRALDQGNIEDRYKNAIIQFGNTNPSVRLAGAYGLYYLAIDNEDRRENICDVLCVHIRDLTTSAEPVFNKKSYFMTYKAKPSNEVRSILDLLINRNNERNFPFKSDWINLSNAHLNGADLNSAQLQGATLENAQLQGATLENAQLQGAILGYAQLKKANLKEAQLQGANLWRAQLQWASLEKAQFQRANLKEAQLQGADLRKAEFQEVDLYRVQLQGANLNEIQLQGASLREAEIQGANLWRAELQGAVLDKTDFRGAFTEQDNRTHFRIDDAIKQLNDRSGKETKLENAIFSGDLRGIQSQDYRNKMTAIVHEFTYNNKTHYADYTQYQRYLDYFNFRIEEIEKIIKDNKGKPTDNSIPSEAITGIYPKAEADKIIAMLEKIKKTIEPNN